MSGIVIQAEDLAKQYRLGTVGTGTLSHDLNRWWHRIRGLPDPYVTISAGRTVVDTEGEDYVWALRDVSMEVRSGEVLGVIGRNGQGKSTLLKILSRITAPTRGEVRIKGRIGSLLEVGTGFHPELTGRENIYLNGAILGMTRAEVTSRFDAIVSFSGCEAYIDTPVKRYSSGMLVRLAFSVAAHLEPEILLVDEVLAVGDAAFQKKCLGKMGEVASEGRTVLLVSHNMATVESLCSRAIMLEGGTIRADGDVIDVVSEYMNSFEEGYDPHDRGAGRFVRGADESGVIRSVSLHSADGGHVAEVRSGQPVSFLLELESETELKGVIVGLHIEDDQGRRVTSLHTSYHPGPAMSVVGRSVVHCRCEGLPLAAGRYYVTAVTSAVSLPLERAARCMFFDVSVSDVFGTGKFPPAKDGVVVTRGAWELEQGKA